MTDENELIAIQRVRTPKSVLLTLRVLAIIFGIFAIAAPLVIGEIMVVLFGIFILITSIGMLAALYEQEMPEPPKWAIITSCLGIIIGIWMIFNALYMGFGLYYFIGAWAIVTGLLQLYYTLKGEMPYRAAMAISAIISLIFGFLVLTINPLIGWAILIQVTGIFAIIDGIIGFGFTTDPRNS